jgi:hypothetical protein
MFGSTMIYAWVGKEATTAVRDEAPVFAGLIHTSRWRWRWRWRWR